MIRAKMSKAKGRVMDKLIMALMWLLIIGVIGFGVYVLITYGGKPITEIPAWAVWFFMKR